MKISFDKINKFWKSFTLFTFVLVCWELVFLSREVVHRGVEKKISNLSEIDIDICYPLFLDYSDCYHIENFGTYDENDSKKVFQKINFTCDFKNNRITCVTKGFKKLKIGEVIEKFKGCNLSDLESVEIETGRPIGLSYEYYYGYICVKHKFSVQNRNETSKITIKSNQKQNEFRAFITLNLTYEDGLYRTKRTQFINRKCWKEENENECTETNKKIFLEMSLYSAKNLQHPYATNCLDRGNKTQNDCYEECVKEKKNFYHLTYYEKDNFSLEYDRQDANQVLKECGDACNQEDCQILGLYLDNLFIRPIAENEENGSIIVLLDKIDFRLEAMPLYPIGKIFWLFLLSISIFFGLNFRLKIDATLLKATSLTAFKLVHMKKKVKKSKKKFMTNLILLNIGLFIALIIEAFIFNFGKEKDFTFLKKETLMERDVSVSFCFDLCKIVKNEFKNQYENCSNEILMNKTIGQLEEITWDVDNFKAKASMRNTVR